MANLREDILKTLIEPKNIDLVLNNLVESQQNLLKNHSNPVFNKKDKSKILRHYTDLQNIGESLFRYNALEENHNSSEAKSTKSNIQSLVLKGGISNNSYIWHSEDSETTCKLCKSLDGKVFDFYDEVPERPHPNCKCYVEVVENPDYESNTLEYDIEEEKAQNEPCDCYLKIEAIFNQVDVLANDVESKAVELESLYLEDLNKLQELEQLRDKIAQAKAELNNINSTSTYDDGVLTGMAGPISTELSKFLITYPESLNAFLNVFAIFKKNKLEMEEAKNGMDKYYHAKANCTSAALGEMETKGAIVFSVGKELYDFYRKVFLLHMRFNVVLRDCYEDLKADWYGIQQSKEPGYCSDKVKDVNDFVYGEKN